MVAVCAFLTRSRLAPPPPLPCAAALQPFQPLEVFLNHETGLFYFIFRASFEFLLDQSLDAELCSGAACGVRHVHDYMQTAAGIRVREIDGGRLARSYEFGRNAHAIGPAVRFRCIRQSR